MTRGIQVWTEEKIEDLHRQRRGQGEGPNYQPWRKVGDFYSDGVTNPIPSLRFEREIHLFSTAEQDLFMLLERASNVTQLREQFPLSRDLTREVAHSLKIAYPCYPRTNIPQVMTIDFLLDFGEVQDKFTEGWSSKPAEQGNWQRVLELEEIMRVSLERLGATHRLIISNLVPASVVKNLSWVRRSLPELGVRESDAQFWRDHQQLMLQHLRDRSFSGRLGAFCDDYDLRKGAPVGTGLRTIRMLVASRALRFDLHTQAPEMADMSCFQLVDAPAKAQGKGG
ncbi:MAG: TnsA endonuclease N-terminal domain-containing protein [Proteobacteria bacterium]|nr:TnsA endonuclease N-terminal domain-containing protein [Pseudomonadota bacterium]